MLNVRFAHPIDAVVLDEFDDSSKTRPHVGRQSFRLVSNARVELVQRSTPSIYSIAFLQYR